MGRFASSAAATAAALLVTGLVGTPSASAQQSRQSINLSVGGFVPRGADGRPASDVLVNNLRTLIFEVKDFNGPTANAEWLIAFGNNIEGGLGVGSYSRTAPAVYRNYTNSNGSEIEQDLKLRVVPFTATVRLLPLGRSGGFQPYIGGGVGVLRYRYSESGDFVDFSNRSIFHEAAGFVGQGSATGPVILGGARFNLGTVDVGFEARHQAGKGDLPTAPPEGPFAGTQIDLGGMSYLATFNIRF